MSIFKRAVESVRETVRALDEAMPQLPTPTPKPTTSAKPSPRDQTR
jgi:hypothetical protein